MKIALLFILSKYYDLMIQVIDYFKYFGLSILGFCHLIPIFYTRYTSSTTPGKVLSAKVFMHLIILLE